jgi:hypothetical protein
VPRDVWAAVLRRISCLRLVPGGRQELIDFMGIDKMGGMEFVRFRQMGLHLSKTIVWSSQG